MALALSLCLGALYGVVVVLVWRATGRRFGDTEFWPSLGRIARGMLAGDSQDFFSEYVRLLRLLGRYLCKTGCRVGLTVLPVVFAALLLGPLARRYEARHFSRLHAFHGEYLTIDIGGQMVTFDGAGRSTTRGQIPFGPARLVSGSSSVPLADFRGTLAVSNNLTTCLGLQLLGLNARLLNDGPALLIIRPGGTRNNPLWPYLGNLEFTFWTVLLCSSLFANALIKKK